MGILDEIVSKKKERLEHAKTIVSPRDIKSRIEDIEKPRDFKAAIKRIRNETLMPQRDTRGDENVIPAKAGIQKDIASRLRTAGMTEKRMFSGEKIRLIAEIKKASPSKGIIREKFDPIEIASIYEKNQAGAISILTEEDFFQGRLEFIPMAKKITTRPLLRKDFIFDEYQIYESRANEADAILLIAAILDKNQADEYLHIAKELGLSVLFEVHDLKELETAILINADIIGINNRDLKTLKVDINSTFKLKKEIPPDKIVVSESGIKTKDDVSRLEAAGIDAVLIGTAFMEAEDIGKKIEELFGS